MSTICARCSRKLRKAWRTKQDGWSFTKKGGVNLLGAGSHVGPTCRKAVYTDSDPAKLDVVECERVEE